MRRLAATALSAIVVLQAFPAAGRLALRRPGARDVAFQHCAFERAGETRPATWCPTMRLVAVRLDLAVPSSGRLELPLDGSGAHDRGGPVPEGALLIVPETLAYARSSPVHALARSLRTPEAMQDFVWKAAAMRAQPATTDFRIFSAADGTLGLRAVPQTIGYFPALPARQRLEFGPSDRGGLAAVAVWAWTGARARDVATLQPLIPKAGEALVVSFGVPAPGWTAPSPAVTFRVLGGPPGEPGEVLWSRRLEPARRPEDRGWLEAEIDLGRFAGRDTTFVLDAATEGSGLGFPVWGAPTLIGPATDYRPRPNVLLISLDTVRADHLGLHGHTRPTSPQLDAFAAEGVIFERATSTFASTTASHMSMLTALQPCAHRLLQPGGPGGEARLSPSATTLTEALAAAGWATAAVTEDGFIKGDMGFDRGFDRYRDLLADWAAPLGLFPRGIELARAWIEAHGNQPFFFFLHTYQPHEPFKAPPHLAGRWAPGPDGSEMDWLRAAYDEGIRHTDELLGDFLGALRRRGILDDTLVVVTSDHGQEFGERGGFGHARGVHLEQVHVPLVMRHPRLAAGGRRVPDVVSLVDLAPTILELVGVPAPSSFGGTSFAPLLAGAPLLRPPTAFAEHLRGRRQTLFRREESAWIATPGHIALYDLRKDPGQQHDLSGEMPGMAQAGAAWIEDYRRTCDAVHDRLEKAQAPPPLDPERRRALEALGYVQ